MKKILFIGGPGNLSEHTVSKLLDNPENQIGIFTLPESPDKGFAKNVRFFRGDRDAEKDLQQVIDVFNPDVVIDFVCFLPHQAESVAKIIQGKVKHFVFVSTCDVYGYPLSRLPMRESDSWVKTNSPYAENKRLCEEVFNKFYKSGDIPLTIVRPSYSFGNDFVISFLSRDGGKHLVNRLRKGKPVFAPGDETTLLHAGAAYNTGRMIAEIASANFTIGKSYTCGHETTITHTQYIRLFASALGVEPNIVHIPYKLLLKTGRKEVEESILEDVTRHNIAFSMEAFKADFPHFKWEKSLESAADEYIKYNDARRFFDTADEEIFEDKLIAAWEKITNAFINHFNQ